MSIKEFYSTDGISLSDSDFQITRLGIREVMTPGRIDHGGREYPYLLMFFHSPVILNIGQSGEQEVKRGFILWEQGAFHHYGNLTSPWEHSWLIVRGESVGRMVTRHQLPLNKFLAIDVEHIFLEYLKLMVSELRRPGEKPDKFILSNLLELCVYEISRVCRQVEPSIPDNIAAAGEFILQNIAKPLSLGEIAQEAKLSVPRFTVLFRQYYKEAPIRFLIRLRMQRAVQLLEYQHLSIKDVSQEVGYVDQLYFSRQFIKHFGCPPREYRKRLLK